MESYDWRADRAAVDAAVAPYAERIEDLYDEIKEMLAAASKAAAGAATFKPGDRVRCGSALMEIEETVWTRLGFSYWGRPVTKSGELSKVKPRHISYLAIEEMVQ